MPQLAARLKEGHLKEFRLGDFIRQIGVSDSLGGSESIDSGIRIFPTDSFTGSEALSLEARVPISAALSAAEALAIQVSFGLSESLSYTDTLAVEAQIAESEVLTAAEALAIQAQIPISEPLSLAEAIAIQADLSISDSLLLFQKLLQTDARLKETRLGEFRLGQTERMDINISDTREVSDALALAHAIDVEHQIPIVDALSGAAALALEARVPVSASLSLAESLAIQASVAVADAVFFREMFPQVNARLKEGFLGRIRLGGGPALDIQRFINIVDAMALSDVVDMFVKTDLSDSISLSEALDIKSNIFVADSLRLYERQLPLDDIRLGRFRLGEARMPGPIDGIQITAFVPISESMTGSEVIAITNQLSVSDSFVGGPETISFFVSITPTDALVFSESTPIINVTLAAEIHTLFRRGFMVLFDEDVE